MPVRSSAEYARRRLLFYGLLLLLAGLVTGGPFAMAIRYGWGPEVVRAWRVAHTSLLTGGLLLLAVGAVLDRIPLSPRALRAVTDSLVGAAWLLLVVVPVGALAGERGLHLGGSVLGTLVAVGFIVMAVCLFIAVAVLLAGACRGLRDAA